jgi:hypothetical protein
MFGIFNTQAQNDSIIFTNGDVMVGEIKNMKMGFLQVETDYSDDDFKVDWELIKYIKSGQVYLVQTTRGDRYNGPLETTPGDPSSIDIEDRNDGKVTVKLLDIVSLKTVDQTFVSRLDLSLSLGYNLAKANNSHQFSGRVNMGYLSNTVKISAYGSILNSFSEEKQTVDSTGTETIVKIETNRWDAGAGVNFFIVRDWFAMLSNDLLSSSELKLYLRSVTKGGFGNYVVNNQRMYLMLVGGAAWNSENYYSESLDTNQTNPRNSAEAFLGLDYQIFDIGDLKLKTTVYGYPSLTESGRFRTDFTFDINYEFAFDLFFGIGFTLNYDSQPASGSDPTDYVLQTTIGWEL